MLYMDVYRIGFQMSFVNTFLRSARTATMLRPCVTNIMTKLVGGCSLNSMGAMMTQNPTHTTIAGATRNGQMVLAILSCWNVRAAKYANSSVNVCIV